ncbi:MAG: GAF domain-containing protein [Candidatus Lindowbacteria bacterium]|nr:GAF domain-containing protein [Candidatus Lindowbacteria bacterium]
MKFLSRDAAGASRIMLEIVRTLAPRIRQTNLELVALYEAGRIIGERTESGEILSGLLAILSDATSSTRGTAFLLNAAGDVLECRAAFGYETDPSGWSEPLEGGIAGEIIRASNAITIKDFQNGARFDAIQRVGYETPSMLGAALRAQGRAIGVIVLCDKIDHTGRPVPFTSGDASLLSGVAAQASGAIESARLHEEAHEKEKLDRVYFRF